jgi:rubrerythrin
MTDEDLKKMIEDVIADMVKGGELEAGEGGEEEDIDMELDMGADNEEDVDLAELLREIEGDESSTEILASALRREFPNASINVQNIEDTDDEGMEIVINDDIFIADGAYNKWDAMINDEEKSFKSDAELISYLKNNMLSETTNTFTAELEEAHNTINTLRTELNEINLLNAKLLYTNKIFKSKNLNESQKVKVLSSFDKAKSVSEVKIVFETLNEGLTVKTTNIRENLGSASKATVTPTVTTKQPIIESNDAFARMRALAFYNSKH